jgi:molybdenum cofactor cytidylyltransferase
VILPAIILAAGASRRMGTPKALLDWEGRTFLDHLIDTYSDACNPVIVVLGHHAAAIRAVARDLHRAQVVENLDPERGMLSSLQCGLRMLPEAPGFLFTPVDQPAVPSTVARDLAALIGEGARIAIPRYEGKRGHPVACAWGLKEEFLTLPADGQPRDVIQRHDADIRYLEVAEPGVVADVDYPEDYRRLVAPRR